MLKVYNTLTGEKEDFKPLTGNRVNLFVCGPTPYDSSHLGHARTYVAFDVIAKYLRYKGYSVFYLMNITDIDDKIILRARELQLTTEELANKYTQEFFRDMRDLGITSVNLHGKATEHIPEIISQIKVLLRKGYAYVSNGNVYFEVGKLKEFGKLSGQRIEKLRPGARVEVEPGKKTPEDFVMWKRHKRGEPCWQSPWGKGRPGWHIEDTAIASTYFGDQYTVHGGARDLIFPHHESEIGIGEALTEHAWVRYWLHTGFLLAEGDKMSKSRGNFYTIREVLDRYDPTVVRFFLLNTHYRSPVDFSWDAMEEAKNALRRLQTTFDKANSRVKKSEHRSLTGRDKRVLSIIQEGRKRFNTAMDDDFNTREAIAALFYLASELNKYMDEKLACSVWERAVETFSECNELLGIFKVERRVSREVEEKLISLILELREKARIKKDWQLADWIREKLNQVGIIIEDTKEGPRWRYESG